MKNFLFIYLALFSMSAFMFTSCEDDGDALDPDAPMVTVAGDKTATVPAGTMASFDISAAIGKRDLETVTVTVDGLPADLSDFTVNGANPSANPILLVAPETEDGFTYTMEFRAPAIGGTSFTYTVEVEDEKERKNSVDIIVSAVDIAIVFKFNKANIVGDTYDLSSSRTVSNVKFDAAEGNAPLDFIEVSVGGVVLTAGEITYPGANGNSSNPYVLVGSEREVLTAFTIGFTTPAIGGETINYVVTMTDEAGETSVLMVNLTKLIALDGPFTGQFYHMDGAVGCTGGFNLMTGFDVSSSGSDADRDMLNTDQGAMAFTGNWVARNSTLYVKDNTGNLRLTSPKTGAIEIYGLSTPSATISNPSFGDIYVAKLRGTDTYAIIEIVLNDANDNSCNTSTQNRGKLGFRYYRG